MDEKRIIFLGRLKETKGINEFINACINAKLEIRENGYKCEIYGAGQTEELQKRIDETGCNDIIAIKGHINDSQKILQSSRVFCSLQKYGNYPSQSLLEAMSCGNYCIVSDIRDSDRLIKPEFGCLVDQNPKAIAHAIITAMNIPTEQYPAIANAARAFLLENHTVEKSALHYKEIFLSLKERIK